MRRCLVFLCTIVALGAVPWTASAQQTTGSIRGVITDESGAVLPGVTVTLKGSAVPGSPTTVSNETGVYRFPNLPPGNYEISAELAGFSTSQQTGIPVSLGGTAEVNVQLKLSTQSETITVTAESPVVDSTSTEVATNYGREWVENAPVPRFSFFDLINAAPGVSASTSTSSRSQSFGSATNENLYLIDGTDFTAPLTGAAWPWPNTDAIEEIQVLSLGAPADYGNLGGAVFNVVTRQGSNTFHGDGNFYFQDQNLTGRNTDDDQDDGLPYNRDEYKDTTWQLGGPILRDKFWFFGSYQYQRDYASQPGTDPNSPAKFSAKRYFFKLNYQINQNNRLQFQQHDDYYRIPRPGHCQHLPQLDLGRDRTQSLAWLPVVVGPQPDHGRRSPLLRLLWGGPRRSARRRPARGAALLRPRHRPGHRWHLLLVRRQEREDQFLRPRHQVRRLVHGRQPRLQGRHPVQQRPG